MFARIAIFLLATLAFQAGWAGTRYDTTPPQVPVIGRSVPISSMITLFSFNTGYDTAMMDGSTNVWLSQSMAFNPGLGTWSNCPKVTKTNTAGTVQASSGDCSSTGAGQAYWSYNATDLWPNFAIYIRGIRRNGNPIVQSVASRGYNVGLATEYWCVKMRYHEINPTTGAIVKTLALRGGDNLSAGTCTASGARRKYWFVGGGWFDYEAFDDSIFVTYEVAGTISPAAYGGFNTYRIGSLDVGSGTYFLHPHTGSTLLFNFANPPYATLCPMRTLVSAPVWDAGLSKYMTYVYDHTTVPPYTTSPSYAVLPPMVKMDYANSSGVALQQNIPLYCDVADQVYGTGNYYNGSTWVAGHHVGFLDLSTGNLTTIWGSPTVAASVDGYAPNNRMYGPLKYKGMPIANRPGTVVFIDNDPNIGTNGSGKVRLLTFK